MVYLLGVDCFRIMVSTMFKHVFFAKLIDFLFKFWRIDLHQFVLTNKFYGKENLFTSRVVSHSFRYFFTNLLISRGQKSFNWKTIINRIISVNEPPIMKDSSLTFKLIIATQDCFYHKLRPIFDVKSFK